MKNKITHFFFDVDGVLSDFPRYVSQHYPYEYKEENREKYKEWIRVATNHIDTELFKNLPPSPFIDDMIKLKEHLQSRGIIVLTLTSLGGHHHSTRIHSQKKEWLDKHGFSDVVYLSVNDCHEKKYLAHPSAFLMDDHHKNVIEFREYGGISNRYDALNVIQINQKVIHDIFMTELYEFLEKFS
jgi:hypothetical protein